MVLGRGSDRNTKIVDAHRARALWRTDPRTSFHPLAGLGDEFSMASRQWPKLSDLTQGVPAMLVVLLVVVIIIIITSSTTTTLRRRDRGRLAGTHGDGRVHNRTCRTEVDSVRTVEPYARDRKQSDGLGKMLAIASNTPRFVICLRS